MKKNIIPCSERWLTKPLTKRWSWKRRTQNGAEAPRCQAVTTLLIQIERGWYLFRIFKCVCVAVSHCVCGGVGCVCVCVGRWDPVIYYSGGFAGVCGVVLIKARCCPGALQGTSHSQLPPEVHFNKSHTHKLMKKTKVNLRSAKGEALQILVCTVLCTKSCFANNCFF